MGSRNKRNIQQFNGEGYSTWKFRIKALLEELQVLSVVEDEIPAVPDATWTRNNIIAKGTIVEYLSDTFLNFAKDTATAKSILQDLDCIYERKSLARQLALRKQLLNLKLQPDDTLGQHFTKFDNLVSELISAGAKLDEMDKIVHILLTLPSSYDGVVTALETLSEEHLNLVFVKTRLLDQEVKLKTETKMKLNSLHTSTKRITNYNPFGGPNYIYCLQRKKKKNKREYNIQQSNIQSGKSSYKINKMHCNHCGRLNHRRKDCRYLKKQNEQFTNFEEMTNSIHAKKENVIKIEPADHKNSACSEVPVIKEEIKLEVVDAYPVVDS